MRFSWDPRVDTGGCALHAEAEEYDGHPRPAALTVDYSPRFASPIRLAAAATLAFRPFLAGSITFPEKISPELATRVSTLLEPTTTYPGPLELHPKAMPLGSGKFHVETDSMVELGVSAARDSRLRLASSGQAFGHHVTADVTTVPTNASLLEPLDGDELDRSLPYLAAAVLIAEDFGIGTLTLPDRMRGLPRAGATTELLKAAGLSLMFDGVAASNR
jgi:hypothetical protein